ncbi:hypothetical protein BMI86_10945 [Thioclava sp. DLFJ5-1]|uniref:hypothetical protein n=1 Tax=Thioclava sp. DLFJ5-1 TaxID=1915314 RepID=UPI00099614CE|nr:hypothetical protein [Thioclava sp. DLFJ5-1]OOY19981.1 hypothetical protein BMI86_10945 [Thioclava sp. DLFJ5-1]
MLRISILALLSMTTMAGAVDLKTTVLDNPTAYIPPQCYTKTEDAAGEVHNPCQTCHTYPRHPNYVRDADLQTEYAFPGPALENPWRNLFVDRRAEVAATDSAEIRAYVRQDNYHDAEGGIALAAKLADPPAAWDANGNGEWDGYIPDVQFAFDDEGFDRRPDGGLTGWRAFAYQPLPGTFWPTNGSTDDVMIRLPEAFRQSADGVEDVVTYKTNLAIVQALITRADVAIEPTDEAAMGVDLDRDGVMGQAEVVKFAFAPLDGITMHWAGRAGAEDAQLAAGLYPKGTEFVHSVRYINPMLEGIELAARLKELRYMVKTDWESYADLEETALAELKEDSAFPDRTKQFFGSSETGVPNTFGWRLQGFIEDATGDLRPQSFEETVFCVGCHGTLGVNDDSTFAFARKLGKEAYRSGWYHWTQKGLAGTPDRVRADGSGDYAHYLRTNGAGDEFRANAELIEDWLEAGKLPPGKEAALAEDIGPLILPSPERADALNAAYRMIVRDQSFTQGRDATVAPVDGSVWREVEQDQPTGIEEIAQPWYKRR